MLAEKILIAIFGIVLWVIVNYATSDLERTDHPLIYRGMIWLVAVQGLLFLLNSMGVISIPIWSEGS